MDEIKVTPEELRTLAVKMQESRELTENLKNNVYKATEEIRGGTENSMAHNISSKMGLLNQKIGYLYEYLERNILVLNRAADVFEETERKLKEAAERIIVEVPIVHQTTSYTCGAACGAMVLQSLGINISEMTFANEAGSTPEKGTYVYRIANALNSHINGDDKYSYRQVNEINEDQLFELLKTSLKKNRPIIANVQYPEGTEFYGRSTGGHYVAITGVFVKDGKKMVRVNNPGGPNGEIVELPLANLQKYISNGYNSGNGYLIGSF